MKVPASPSLPNDLPSQVLISFQGGATFPQAQTSHAGPRLFTSVLQAPPAAKFFRYFFVVLLDFIPSSTLPSNFPNVQTSLTDTFLTNFSLGISFFLSDLFPNPCIVMEKFKNTFLSCEKPETSLEEQDLPLLRK